MGRRHRGERRHRENTGRHRDGGHPGHATQATARSCVPCRHERRNHRGGRGERGRVGRRLRCDRDALAKSRAHVLAGSHLLEGESQNHGGVPQVGGRLLDGASS